MKKTKIIVVSLLVMILLLSACTDVKKDVLTEPRYEDLWYGSEEGRVYENEKIAVITSNRGFYIYDYDSKQVVKEYHVDVKKGFDIEPEVGKVRFHLDKALEKLSISAFSVEGDLSKYHFVYDIKADTVEKKDGNLPDEYIDPQEAIQTTYMGEDLQGYSFKSKLKNEEIFPFKDRDYKFDLDI